MQFLELVSAAGLADQIADGASLGESSNDVSVTGLAYSSAAVNPGSIFFALPGHRQHGAEFIEPALRAGASAVITDLQGAQIARASRLAQDVPLLAVANPRTVMAAASIVFFDNPAASLAMLGVTGTNGKTSTTFLLQAALEAAGRRCGLIGTLGARLTGWEPMSHPRTTPESPDLQALLAQMKTAGADSVAMEVSSIAVREHRVDGLHFDVMGFTGLSHDHLDYHGTMEEYFRAKSDLFTSTFADRGVVLIDDEWGRRLASQAEIPIVTIASTGSGGVDVEVADWLITTSGRDVVLEGPERVEFSLPVATDFAAANAVLAVVMAHTQGVPASIAARAVTQARVPGRMELVASVDGIDFVVDYAHSPDAIERVVASAVAGRRPTGSRVIVVLGAGGDRDQQKRVAMGRAASAADVVVVTDDNPRHEDPAAIREMVRRGVDHDACDVHEIAPREAAIAWAVAHARSGDIVLILGKGHETVQEWSDRVVAFDDRQVLASCVQDQFPQGVTEGREQGAGT